ncbi:MAG: site-2 protease family protein [Patescibacteria group bacterium]|nr:site-2 protease family protein [Patescibacteria group bacterium]
MIALIYIVILIFSVIIHEVSHGYMADRLGDPTARLSGRLTLDPLKHIDPIGSVIVPLATYLLGGFAFGWAKPVPYNPYNLKNKRLGEFLIAAAGPASNLVLALIFGLVIRLVASGAVSVDAAVAAPFLTVVSYVVVINIILAIFNLIPLPPLDGSKLLFSILPAQYGRARYILEAYAPFWVLIVVFFLWQLVSPVIPFIFNLFTGIGS